MSECPRYRTRLVVASVLAVASVVPTIVTAQPPPQPIPEYALEEPSGSDLDFEGLHNSFSITPLVGPATRIISGSFDGDTLLDIAIHDGSQARFVLDVDIFAVGRSALVTASGLVRHRPPGADRDSLLGSDGSGLARWTLEDDGTITSVALGHPAWANAIEHAIGFIGGSASPDLVAISPSTGQILVLLDIDDASPVESSFSTLGVPAQIVLADVDGDGTPEINARTSTGIRNHDPDGTLNWKIRGHVPGGSIARLPGATADRIAWVMLDPTSPNEHLVLLDGSVAPVVVPLGEAGTTALIANDLDGDGQWDLALFRDGDDEVQLLIADATGFDESDPSREQTVPGAGGHGVVGAPCRLDIDKDGDLDILYAQSAGSIGAIRVHTIDAVNMAPAFHSASLGLDGQTFGPIFLTFSLDNGTEVPTGTTHLQAAVYRKANVASPTESDPITSVMLPYVEQPQGSFPLPYADWVITLPEVALSFDSIYSIVIRYVTLDGQAEIIDRGPARVVLFTSEVDEGEPEPNGPLEYIFGRGDYRFLFWTVEGGVPWPSTDKETSTGTVIETKPVPDPEDDDDPVFEGEGGGD